MLRSRRFTARACGWQGHVLDPVKTMQGTPHSPRLQRLERKIAEIATSRRRWPWAMALLAIVLSLPTLTIGWIADDYAERWVAMHDRAMGLPGTIVGMTSYVTG